MEALQAFIDSRIAAIAKQETAGNLAWWNLATTGDEKDAQELEKSKIALRKIYSSRPDFEFLQACPTIQDPLLSRQRTLLLQQYRENQISQKLIEEMSGLEAEIEKIYTNFRPEIKGKQISNNTLKKILTESRDSQERQEAWEASKHIGKVVEARVLKLISLRNRSARQAGFGDYYTMRLELQELDGKRLFELLDRLDKASSPIWSRYRAHLDRSLAERCGILVDELQPWHYHDPFFQEAPAQDLNLDRYYEGHDLVALGGAYFQGVDLPVEDILARSDLFERERKNQHAFCTCIDRKEDIRMLCNMRPNDYWMGTLLHELGHAVYYKYIDQSLPYLLRTYAHTSSTEASAMLFGRLSKAGSFLQKYAALDAAEAQQIDKQARQQTCANLLVFARWALVMIHFERDMYQKPGSDLNALWWKYVSRFQKIQPSLERKHPDWAAKLHLACAPVYYQNYILGEMTASQLLLFIPKPLVASPEVGHFLKTRFFSLGALLPWEETLKAATGEALNPDYFSNDLNEAN